MKHSGMANRITLNISITPEQSSFVSEAVDSGRYLSSSEVVREALRDLQLRWEIRKRQIEKLNEMVNVGAEQIKRGDVIDGDVAMRQLQEKIDRYKASHP